MPSFAAGLLADEFGDVTSDFARSVLHIDQMEKAKRDRMAQRAQARERWEYSKSRDAKTDQWQDFNAQTRLVGHGYGTTPVAGAQSITTPNGQTFYKQQQPVQPPTGRLTGRDPRGRNVTYTGTPEQLEGVDVRPLPNGGRGQLTPGQAATEADRQRRRVEQEALGNALTWVHSGQIDRPQGIRFLVAQHKIPVGDASRIWEQAQYQAAGAEGRDLLNQQRAQGDESSFDARLAQALGGEGEAAAEAVQSPGGLRGLVGGNTAMAADSGTDQQRKDWDAAAAVLRSQGKNPESIIGPRP